MTVTRIFVATILAVTFVFISVSAGEKEGGSASASPEISGLLESIGKKVSDFKSLKTSFVQEKNLSVFQKKIILKGRVCLQKPGKLAWHVDHPCRYSVVITDRSIRQWDEGTKEVQETPLSGNPVFQNITNQLAVWFSGDYCSLLQDYCVTVREKKPVILRFVPKEKNMAAKVIKSITVTFREDERYIKRIDILEVGGDSTTIVFDNTEFNPPPQELDFEVKRRV
ncbi:MAG: outer membrane lipoprotein carrier protein LolA [Pseudomonadota bacterium]